MGVHVTKYNTGKDGKTRKVKNGTSSGAAGQTPDANNKDQSAVNNGGKGDKK